MSIVTLYKGINIQDRCWTIMNMISNRISKSGSFRTDKLVKNAAEKMMEKQLGTPGSQTPPNADPGHPGEINLKA